MSTSLLAPRSENPSSGRKRAQRFPIRALVRYRVNGEKEWRRGTTENISFSGVLFQGEHVLEPNTPVEISLAVPVVGFGEGNAQVACRGTVVRATQGAGAGDPSVLATSISHYRIIRP